MVSISDSLKQTKATGWNCTSRPVRLGRAFLGARRTLILPESLPAVIGKVVDLLFHEKHLLSWDLLHICGKDIGKCGDKAETLQ
jgi:hypothetical protein